jgi:hypothetical protein
MLRMSVATVVGAALVAGSLAGCASKPQPPQPPVTRQVQVTTANVEDVQKAGYKIVNKDGQKLYCRTDLITGSHVRTRTQCLTEQELHDQMEQTKESMDWTAGGHHYGPLGK